MSDKYKIHGLDKAYLIIIHDRIATEDAGRAQRFKSEPAGYRSAPEGDRYFKRKTRKSIKIFSI